MKSRQNGFTLIELLTALSIFSIMLLVVMGIFSRFVISQRRDIAEQKLQENVRFALEIFNREARTAYGSTYRTTNNKVVYFRNQNKRCVSYIYRDAALLRAEIASPGSHDCAGLTYTALYQPITSNDVVIEKVTFMVMPAQSSDGARLNNQGFITIGLSATAPAKPESTLQLQSSIASRQINPYRP